MYLSAFFQSLVATFLIITSIGPVFLTTANIAMTKGYKSGCYAILGCIAGDIVFIILATFATKTLISTMPQWIIIALMFLAVLLLIKIAYTFWKADVNSIKAVDVMKKDIALSLKMLFLTLSSPLSIVGYSVIFTAIVATHYSVLLTMLGGCCGVILAHSVIVISFGFLGKKINNKILILLNKISACLIASYAILILVNAVKKISL